NDLANAVHAAAISFHLPGYLMDLAREQRYPHTVRMQTATTGYSFGLWAIPPGAVDTHSYHSASFTLGSSGRVIGNGGQMDSPALKWRRGSGPVRSMADHRAAFLRYRDEAEYTLRRSSIPDQGIKN